MFCGPYTKRWALPIKYNPLQAIRVPYTIYYDIIHLYHKISISIKIYKFTNSFQWAPKIAGPLYSRFNSPNPLWPTRCRQPAARKDILCRPRNKFIIYIQITIVHNYGLGNVIFVHLQYCFNHFLYALNCALVQTCCVIHYSFLLQCVVVHTFSVYCKL